MKYFLRILMLVLLCAGITLAGRDRRQEKLADERNFSVGGTYSATPSILSTTGWATFDIESATSRYKGIEILPGGVIWIFGNNDASTASTFYGYRSVDNGKTWKKFTVPSAPAASGVTNIAAKDSNIAVVGLNNGYLFRTTNGGAKWDSVFAYADVNVAWMDAVNCVGTTRDTMIAVGDADNSGLFVGRSTNAGATWTRLTNLPTTDSITAAVFYAGYYTYGQCTDVYQRTFWSSWYYGSGVDPRMLVSTDAGGSWAVYKNVLPGGNAYDTYLRSINFKDQNVGYGVIKGLSSSSTNWMVKTTDGGKTWSDTISVEKGIAHNDALPTHVKPIRGTNNVFAGGYGINGSKAWWSTDNGATWTNLNIPLGPTTNAWVLNSAFTDAQNGYAVGGQINLKLTPSTGVGGQENGQPVAYTLQQNYPNPFNPTTTIGYSVAKATDVQLKVYDLLGREVATLVEGQHSPGSYSVTFDASRLSSGVYFYTMRAGDFVSAKSLVLMK
jgi:photosystem II stability/assembly factor-like uncharacterized protein